MQNFQRIMYLRGEARVSGVDAEAKNRRRNCKILKMLQAGLQLKATESESGPATNYENIIKEQEL